MKVLLDRTVPRYKQLQHKGMYFNTTAEDQDIFACTGCDKKFDGLFSVFAYCPIKRHCIWD